MGGFRAEIFFEKRPPFFIVLEHLRITVAGSTSSDSAIGHQGARR
jgi:hypothetical protein